MLTVDERDGASRVRSARTDVSFDAMPSSDSDALRRYGSIAAFIATLVFLFLRMPERLTDGFLWAEDVPVFLRGAIERGLRAIVEPYAGYYHAVPRLIAAIQAQMPLEWAPFTLSWEIATLVAAIAAYLFGFAFRFYADARVDRRWSFVCALLFSLAPVLVPTKGEVFLSITNLQWLLGPLLLVLIVDICMVDRDAGTPARWAKRVCIAAIALTGPFVVVLLPIWLPLVAYRWWRGERAIRTDALLLIAISALQLVSLSATGTKLATASVDWEKQFGEFLLADFLFGSEHLVAVRTAWIASTWVVIALLLLGTLKSMSRDRLVILAFLAGAALVWISGALRVGSQTPHILPLMLQFRYGYPASIMLFWALVMLMALPNPIRYIAPVLVALPIATMSDHWRVDRFSPWSISSNASESTAIVDAPPGWKTTIRYR